MATLAAAVRAGVLEEFGLPEWEERLAIRSLYVAPALFEWVESESRLDEKARRIGGRTLLEHLDQAFSDLRCAQRPLAGDLRRMMPNRLGVWSLHPPGLRVYGWFPTPHAFAAVTAALEADTKTDKTLNDRKRDAVLMFIKTAGLAAHVFRGDRRALFPLQG